MFEHRTDPLLSCDRFFWRVISFLAASAALVSIALGT
jgi:hypothetical protein